MAAQAKPAEAKGKKAAAPKEQRPEPTTLVEALLAKQAILVKIRANGTVRSLPYLAPGTKSARRPFGWTPGDRPARPWRRSRKRCRSAWQTVRRYVTGLALAHEVESDKHDDAWTKGEKNVVVHRVAAKAAAA